MIGIGLGIELSKPAIFDPIILSPYLALDPEFGVSTSGSNITNWASRFGSNYGVPISGKGKPTLAANVFGSRHGIVFDYTSTLQLVTPIVASSGFTVVLSTITPLVAGGAGYHSLVSNDSQFHVLMQSSNSRLGAYTNAFKDSGFTVPSTAGAHILSVTSDGANATARWDGAAVGASFVTSNQNITEICNYSGAVYGWGTIGNLWIFPSLSAANVSLVEKYIAKLDGVSIP